MRYIKIYRYILTIDLCEDSINNENRSNIINKVYATYNINKFKILEIEDIVTKELKNNYDKYKVGDIICETKKYYLIKERAFFEIDYDQHNYSDEYKPIDKLYYINFFSNYYGLHKSWYDSGQLKEEFYHINGMCEGLYREYYENGNIKCEYYHVNNEIIKL